MNEKTRAHQMAECAAELASTTGQRSTLEAALSKWFDATFLKSPKLETLKAIHDAGHFASFEELLRLAGDPPRIKILSKIDPHRPEMQMKPVSEALAHIRKLASDDIKPAQKPKPMAGELRKPKNKVRTARPKVAIISGSKY